MLANRDKQLKAERGYHGKSYVRPDGSECLLDRADWELRKRELWARAGGRCEFMIQDLWPEEGFKPQRCSEDGSIPAHIEPRHPVRDDRLTNLKLLCRRHDKLTEKQNWRVTRFGEKAKPIQKRLGGKA